MRANTTLASELTGQQINVMELSTKGYTAKQIGERLGISEKTIKFHKTNIYKKLGVKNILEASFAYQSYQMTQKQSVVEKTTNYVDLKKQYDIISAELDVQRLAANHFRKRCEQLEHYQRKGIVELPIGISTVSSFTIGNKYV